MNRLLVAERRQVIAWDAKPRCHGDVGTTGVAKRRQATAAISSEHMTSLRDSK
jgi:hypothetical protein